MRRNTVVLTPDPETSTGATGSSADRSAASSWASAVSVAATNRRDTADVDVDVAACSVRAPTGSGRTP